MKELVLRVTNYRDRMLTLVEPLARWCGASVDAPVEPSVVLPWLLAADDISMDMVGLMGRESPAAVSVG